MSRDTNTYKEVPDNLDFSKIKVGIKSLEDAVLVSYQWRLCKNL